LALAAALALILAAWMTASAVPLLDPDEGYYPATAAESVDAGAGWDLRFNDAPRWDKPVLAYALIESAFALFGRSTAIARLPSALEAAALVLIVAVLVRSMTTPAAGGLCAVVLASTLGVQVFARAAHPEIAVVLSIAVTQLLLASWLIVPPGERIAGLPVLIGLSMAYGLLAKGPVAVAIPAIGVLVAAPWLIDLRQRWQGALLDGLAAGAVALLLAAPWYAAMAWRHGVEFLQVAVWQQNIGRYTGQLAEHHASAVYFILPTAIAVLPWTAFVLPACARVRRSAGDRRAALRLCAAVFALTSFAFYSLSVSKLASYSLVFQPPLSVLIALYLEDDLAVPSRRSGAAMRATSLILLGLGVALFALPAIEHRSINAQALFGGAPAADAAGLLFWTVVPVATVLVAGAAVVELFRGPRRVAAVACVGFALPLAAILSSRTLVQASYPWQRFGAQIAAAPAPAWVYSYRTPSLTFYAGRPVQRLGDENAMNAVLDRPGPAWVVIDQSLLGSGRLAERITARTAAVIDRSGRLALVRLS
jgi:4-amino-4-deoxy-L-arabinose transferase-like glycosyltransferase